MREIVVVGSLNMDLVIGTDARPLPGETVRGYGFMLSPGGKGANQAVAAARLGAGTAMIGRVGDDLFGRDLIAGTRGQGVDVQGVLTTAGMSTGVAVIVVSGGENSIILEAGANAALLPGDLQPHREIIAGAGALLLQMEVPLNTTYAAREMARGTGCRVFLNPAPAPGEPIPPEVLMDLDFLTPNETECAAITGTPLRSEDDAFRAVDALRARGVRHPVITLGGEGAAFYDGSANRRLPAWPTQVVDTTAAGDTFSAAMAVVISRGSSVYEAVDFARRAASVAVSRRGAQDATPRADEIPVAGV